MSRGPIKKTHLMHLRCIWPNIAMILNNINYLFEQWCFKELMVSLRRVLKLVMFLEI